MQGAQRSVTGDLFRLITVDQDDIAGDIIWLSCQATAASEVNEEKLDGREYT